MKNLKQFLFGAILLLGTSNSGISQVTCNIFVSPADTTICPGDSVCFSAIASITAGGQSFNFDGGSLPAGWGTTGGSAWGTPCGSSLTGTPYYWASTAGTGTPQITTAAFDISCGGMIQFDMVYSIQGQGTPCEGPDLSEEGVSLQYSLDGITWFDIVYYSPAGFELPANPGTGGAGTTGATQYTSWSTFNVPIPLAALSTGTMFRWIQLNSSGSDFDNWGLDDINVNAGPCNSATVDWSNGLSNTNQFCAAPTTDSAFVALVYDTLGVFQCASDTIFIDIIGDDMTYDLVDSMFLYCPYDSAEVQIENLAGAQPVVTYDWSTGSTVDSTFIYANANKHDTIWYQVLLTDGCGYFRNDSVVLIVNQLLTIDTLMQFPASACDPDGAVSAMVSGLTVAAGNPFYHWDDQANHDNLGTGSFIDASVWSDLSSGWYHFTITDDVCSESDSVFVEMEDPPMAQFTTSDDGCGPLNVTLTNESENTTVFYWDFGDATDLTVNDMTPFSHEYTQTATIMLIAYTDATLSCSDTTYQTVTVVPCGCTDPLADNYDPSALIDDQSCTYPTPTAVVPNIFTPNADYVNNLFVMELTNWTKVEIVVTNRWGNVMFQTTSDYPLNPAWDGTTLSGNEAQEGTYFYTYLLTGTDGTTQIDGHGFVQLARD
ncbi:MAG: gliding motility-associated C-terminal domain-containing protein [Crocinitomicaceae bacterium]|nr:gliding motility-associated C-terminal domain-containing protein [Crocinitomicaceae bacterium]